MKKLFYTIALLLAASTLFISCGSSDIAVESVTITGCNPDAPLLVNRERLLTATVLPENATNRTVTWSSSHTNIATVDNTGLVTAHAVGTTTITATTAGGIRATCVITVTMPPGIGDPTATTDPGVVINGIRWATRNLDYPGTFAPYPHSFGRFYQWGRRNLQTHHWPAIGPVPDWSDNYNRTAWTAANDPCPEGWRVPTRDQLMSLVNAGSVWTPQDGVNGRLFGTPPNQIFLPAAGTRSSGSGARGFLNDGWYWSNTPGTIATAASFLRFNQSDSFANALVNRANGFPIRCVALHN